MHKITHTIMLATEHTRKQSHKCRCHDYTSRCDRNIYHHVLGCLTFQNQPLSSCHHCARTKTTSLLSLGWQAQIQRLNLTWRGGVRSLGDSAVLSPDEIPQKEHDAQVLWYPLGKKYRIRSLLIKKRQSSQSQPVHVPDWWPILVQIVLYRTIFKILLDSCLKHQNPCLEPTA